MKKIKKAFKTALFSGFKGFGGRGWIRTTEVIDDRFTVCQTPFIYNDFEKCNTEVTQ